MATIVVYNPSDPTVAGKVTGYYPSANTPDYDGETNKLVDPDLSALSSVPVAHWKHSAGAIVEMTTAEKEAFISLATYKAAKSLAIKIRTGELFAPGFTYDSATFTADATANFNYLVIKDNTASLTFPKNIAKLDGNSYALTEANVGAFFTAAVTFVEGLLDGQRALLHSVAVATNKAGVDAVVDNR